MYNINKLEINNFKLIKGKKIIDFSNSSLIVLDGPNGYGKTSIFDAIEILITGRRNLENTFNCEYSEKDKPVVYAYNINKPIVLKGEFSNEDKEKLIILRKIDEPSKLGTMSKLKNRFNIYKLDEFDDSEGEAITQEKVNNLLGLYPNEDIYNLMYYIQQEETLSFLKENEHKRKETLSKLFNMANEEKEYDKIIKLRDKLNSKRKEIGGVAGKGGKIHKVNLEIDKIKVKNIDEVEYKKLIKQKNIYWDEQVLELDYDSFQKALLQIDKIQLLKENLSDYNAIKYNNLIDFTIHKEQEDVLKGSFVPEKYIEEYSKRKDTIKLVSSYKRFSGVLNSNKFIKIKEFLDEKNEMKLEDEFNIDKLYVNVKDIINKSNNMIQLDSLIININVIRKNLEKEYQKYSLNKIEECDVCPLCGHDYKISNLKLEDKIQEKEKYFTDQLNSDNKKLDKFISETQEEFIIPLKEFLERKIQEKIKEVNYKPLLDLANLNKKRIYKFRKLCNKFNVDLQKYMLDFQNYSEEKVESNLSLLKEELSNKKKEIKNNEVFINKNKFEEIIINVFDKNIEIIESINKNDIVNKKLYIESICNKQQNINRAKKIKEKEILIKQYLKIQEEYIKCKEIAEIYKENIGSYSDEIIKILQIPIYIYSGKIIQDYQGGLGVFIRSEETNQQLRLKFVNNNKSKHDLLNKFSSGQLSGLILSIMLSLNNVFSNSKLNTILIDDPLQSMDDINMTSFVELLRNEFYKSQIIISTHDERISRYIRYKFLKFGLEQIRYNVKEELKV